MAAGFGDFLLTVPEAQRDFAAGLHQELEKQGCKLVIKEAKRGYLCSYQWDGRTIMNWVFRKSGMLARIYGDHVGEYQQDITDLPVTMQEKMKKARDCKRLLDPAKCSPTCVKGFVYELDGTTHKKCRNDGMFFLLDDQSSGYIKKLVLEELKSRKKTA